MRMNKILEEDMKYIAGNFGSIDRFSNSDIVITGCAGFLGFYFVNFFSYLMKEGVKIKSLYLLDNFILGKHGWLNGIKNKNTKIKFFDISKDSLGRIEGIKNADFIIHMASIASPSFYRKYPLQTMEANVWGLKNLLDFYQKIPIEGLLFFSSSEVYGDPPSAFIPTREDYRGHVAFVGPRACYDESKRFGETLCYAYAAKHGMPIVVVRPFNNYGPGMNLNDKRVPADFMNSVINNRNIEIYSQGTPTRTFCYVADAIVGYLKALTYGKYDCFNIGIDRPEISVRQLAEIYKDSGKKISGYKGKILFKKHKDRNYLVDNPSRRCPDISKARKLLGFVPAIMVQDGVGRYLRFLKEEKER